MVEEESIEDSFPRKKKTIDDIEKRVDKLIFKNRRKLELDYFSSEKQKKESIFFVKQKKEKTKKINKNSKSKKHISIKKPNKKNKVKKTSFKKTKKIEDNKEQKNKKIEESISKVSSDEASWLDKKLSNIVKKADKSSNKIDDKVKPKNKDVILENLDEFSASVKKDEVSKSEDDKLKKEIKKEEIKKDSKVKLEENVNKANEQNKQDLKIDLDAPDPINENISISTGFENKPSQKSSSDIKIDEISPDNHIKYIQVANNLKTHILSNLGYSENNIEELDFYPLHEPFAYVEIVREKDSLDKRYVLIEEELNENEKQILQFIRESLNSINIDTDEMEEFGETDYLIKKIEQILEDYMLIINPKSKEKIIYFLKKQFLGLSKLEVLMRDPNIEDISCDGAKVPIFLYHRRFGSLRSNVEFDEEEELSAFVIRLAQKCGKHISIAEPMLDATMPDGSRIQMTLSSEVTAKGSTFTIRKFKEDPFSPPDLIEFNSMSAEMVAYLWLAVENGINALIAGGTAAGKTSALNAISLFIPRDSKIVSIEETREINLPHPNWIPGVSRSGFGEVVGNKVTGEIDLYDLMKAALRQRPEYILVGEIRGREAYVLFQAMATGHTTYSTVHADSAQSLIHRLEGKPINIPRIMLQALDIVCIQIISRVKNKRARRCKQIIEIIDIDPTTKEILTNEVFRWDPVDDRFIYSGKSYILERIRSEKDLSRDEMADEIRNRAKLLDWMNRTNIREFKKVATIIAKYEEHPEKVLEKIKD